MANNANTSDQNINGVAPLTTEQKILAREESKIEATKLTLQREITLLKNENAELKQEREEARESYHYVLSTNDEAIATIKVLQKLIAEKLDYIITEAEVRGG